MKITIDSAGRVVIPKAIREQAGLYTGATLEVRLDEDQIVLKPTRPAQRLERRGRYVAIVRADAAEPVSEEMVDLLRDEIWRERAEQTDTED